jgi:hypothetical protein
MVICRRLYCKHSCQDRSKDGVERLGWSWGVPQIRNALPAVRPAQPTCSSQGQKIGPNREAAGLKVTPALTVRRPAYPTAIFVAH